MGSSSSHCGDLVGGLCVSVVDSGVLDIFHLISSSYLWLAFVYAMIIMILSMHTTGSPVGGGGGLV